MRYFGVCGGCFLPLPFNERSDVAMAKPDFEKYTSGPFFSVYDDSKYPLINRYGIALGKTRMVKPISNLFRQPKYSVTVDNKQRRFEAPMPVAKLFGTTEHIVPRQLACEIYQHCLKKIEAEKKSTQIPVKKPVVEKKEPGPNEWRCRFCKRIILKSNYYCARGSENGCYYERINQLKGYEGGTFDLTGIK